MNFPSAHKTRAVLPRELRAALLAGDLGELHLTEIAARGLTSIREEPGLIKERTALYADMLLAAWESTFSPNKGSLLRLDDVTRILTPPVRRLLDEYVCPLDPMELPEPEALAQAAEHAALPSAARLRMLADSRRLSGAWEEAAGLYEASAGACPLPETLFRLGDCRALLGEKEAAMDALRRYLAMRPWSVHGLLRLYDIFSGRDAALDWPDGQGALLIYTWNHADKLDEMLESLAAAEKNTPSGKPLPLLFALNNGSTDDTASVLAKWEERFKDRMTVIATPVNMGAPAARNWLMSLPEVNACDWAVYLDDDVLLPPDWLARFGAAMRAYPEADVYGARILSRDKTYEIQNADLHLLEPPSPPDGNKTEKDNTPSHINISTMHSQNFDFGGFSYMRPCASVTGCVHLFRMEALRQSGPFGLVFSPSQFDDFEHDLRMARKGKLPVYTGHLAILHMRRSLVHITRSHMATLCAHMAALQTLHTPADAAAVRALDARVAEQDLLRKEVELRNAGAL